MDKKNFLPKSRSFEYDPQADNGEGTPASNEVPRALAERAPYYGPTLAPAVVEEIKAWAAVLNALKDGLPIPYNPQIFIEKIERIERDRRIDLSTLKNTAPPSAEVREAKDFKPFIYAVLTRLEEIGELKVK